MKVVFEPIGILHTPYKEQAPFHPIDDAVGEFYLELDDRFKEGLSDLDSFSHVYVLFYFHRSSGSVPLMVSPPWTDRWFGVFATRSPRRPNGIGLSIVRLRKIEENRVYISGIDALDGTPVLDIKPYTRHFDLKADANSGWMDEVSNFEELREHFSRRFREH
ncbi:MAG: tRNA (N6-threonylcarbamoyladenosine(37)-N6)-methyltransferase TrmO [Candidatus Helarchaeales archaeon]